MPVVPSRARNPLLVGRVRAVAVLGAAFVLAMVGGCTSTVNGVGSLRSQTGFPAPPSTSAATPVDPGGPTAPVPNSSGGRPPSCPASSCRLRLSASLASPYGIAVWADAATGTAILAVTNAGAPVGSHVLPGESPAQLNCVASTDRSNCVLVDLVGAHGSVAHLVREDNGSLVLGAPVEAGTPTMQALDLNRDGWVDVAGLQNDATPNYAAGQVFWQTWLSDGAQLHSSGCGVKSHSQPAAPSEPLTGDCP